MSLLPKLLFSFSRVLWSSTEHAGTGLQHARANAARSSSCPLLEPLQLSSYLAGCDVKSSLRGGGCGRVCGG